MRGIGRRRSFAAACALVAAAALSTSAVAAYHVLVDLGRAPPGTIDLFEVTARNDSCDEPQNFRFVPRNTPWLKLVHGSQVRDIRRGTSKRFVAVVDLTGLKSGHHKGQLDVICDTCGDFVLYRCHIDTRTIALEVEVTANGRSGKADAPLSVRALSQ